MQIMAADNELGVCFLLAILSTLTILCTGQTFCFMDYQLGYYIDPATSFRISWTWKSTQTICDIGTVPADQVIVNYAMKLRDNCQEIAVEDQQFTEISEDIDVGAIVIEGLVPYSTYEVSVSLWYNGQDTQSFPFTTGQTRGAKPGSPIYVRSTSVTASTATFEWEAPPCGYRGAGIVQYLIQIRESDKIQPFTTRTFAYKRYYTVSNLKPCTEYVFKVTSIATVRSDPVSKTITTSGIFEPYNLRAPNADLTSITVEWEPHNLCDDREPVQIESYTIEYGIEGDGNESVLADGSVTRYRLQNLTSHVTYAIRISASGKNGIQWSWTPVITKTTKEGVSSEPLNVTATKVTTNTVTLTWNSPLNPNGVITKYKIIYTTQPEDDSAQTTTKLNHLDVTNMTSTLKNLEPATTYKITIGANKESAKLDGNQMNITVTTKADISFLRLIAGIAGAIGGGVLFNIGLIIIFARRREMYRNLQSEPAVMTDGYYGREFTLNTSRLTSNDTEDVTEQPPYVQDTHWSRSLTGIDTKVESFSTHWSRLFSSDTEDATDESPYVQETYWSRSTSINGTDDARSPYVQETYWSRSTSINGTDDATDESPYVKETYWSRSTSINGTEDATDESPCVQETYWSRSTTRNSGTENATEESSCLHDTQRSSLGIGDSPLQLDSDLIHQNCIEGGAGGEYRFNEDILESDLIYHNYIGGGAGGEVHRVTWTRSHLGDIEAAAKKIRLSDYDTDEDIRQEVNMLKNLKHNNVIRLFGTVISNTHLTIVTELGSKGSLNDFLKNTKQSVGKLSEVLFKKWVLEAALALQYAHKQHIVHCDVKSGNFVISEDDVLKLCDLGISRHLNKTTQTLTGKGTAFWLAPEVFVDQIRSFACDVYAYGLVVWELNTCESPGKGFVVAEAYKYKVGTEDYRPPIPSTCPDSIRKLIKICWHADYKVRPSMDSVVEYIEGDCSNEAVLYEVDTPM